MSTTQVQYLGLVRRAPKRGDQYRYATVEPLVESDSAGVAWLGGVVDAHIRFPKRGLVHWHDAPSDLQVGSVWQFSIDEHPDASRAERPELYQLQRPEEPIEVVDLSQWTDLALLRSSFTAAGIPLSPAPIARRCLLKLANDVWVGPILIKPGTASGLFAFDAPVIGDASKTPVRVLSAIDIGRVQIEGDRWFVSPRLELGSSSGVQNWTSDAQVAQSVLRRLRKMDREVVKALEVTDGVFREYLAHVEKAGFGSVDPAMERARADRLRGIREVIQRDKTLLAEAADSLSSIDPVRAEIERQASAKIAEAVQAGREKIEQALAGATKQLGQLELDIAAKVAEMANLDAQLAAKQSELDAATTEFDKAVAQKLQEIARKPEEFLADAIAMGAVLRAIQPSDGTSRTRQSVPPVKRPAAAVSDSVAGVELNDDNELRSALARHAAVEGFGVQPMLGLHVAFVAGLTPIVTGSRAYQLLRAYANAVAGGRLHWIPVGGSLMEPEALLGRYDLARGRIVPSPSGLLDVLVEARTSGGLYVIVLEGFNRSPVEAYLSPLLDAANASRVGDTLRTIPLANHGFVGEEDPYEGYSRVLWPTNVVISCLPRHGTATLPLHESLDHWFAYVDADDAGRLALPDVSAAPPPTSHISKRLWEDALARAERLETGESDSVSGFAKSLSVPSRDREDAQRLNDLLRQLGVPAAEAASLAIAGTLIPRFRGDARLVEQQVNASGLSIPTWRAIHAEAARLRD